MSLANALKNATFAPSAPIAEKNAVSDLSDAGGTPGSARAAKDLATMLSQVSRLPSRTTPCVTWARARW